MSSYCRNAYISTNTWIHAGYLLRLKASTQAIGMTTMRDSHDLYGQSNVSLEEHIFENFGHLHGHDYGFDHAWYYTAPSVEWDAALKITGLN